MVSELGDQAILTLFQIAKFSKEYIRLIIIINTILFIIYKYKARLIVKDAQKV